MSNTLNKYRDFATLFSRSEILQWKNENFDSIDVKLNRYKLNSKYKGYSYLSILKRIYKDLEKNYPNEYILKNNLLNNWLKEYLGCRDSVIFNEFRLGKAIVDIAMFNGMSVAFEIKSIFDRKDRLPQQLEIYKQLFDEVYLIIPESLLPNYLNIDKEVGIIVFNDNEKNFCKVKEAMNIDKISIEILMEVLHTNEYKSIVNDYYGKMPLEMNSFNQFKICKSLIAKIPYPVLRIYFIHAMKKRDLKNSFFNSQHREFNQLSLAMNLSHEDRKNMISRLQSYKI